MRLARTRTTSAVFRSPRLTLGARCFQADKKLQITKDVFSMLLKQKRETKLGDDYWREREQAIVKCIGVVSSEEFYNPHYTWIRYVTTHSNQVRLV